MSKRPNKESRAWRRVASLALLSLIVATGCETSFEEAEADFNNQNGGGGAPPPPPPPPPPSGGGFNPVFSEVQSNVFTPTCATSGCHSGANPPQGLNLEAANSYAMLVGIASTQDGNIQRVNPGNPNNSYLIQKMEGSAASGGVMPPSGGLPQADIDVIRQWITDGATDDTAPPPAAPIRVASLSVAPGSVLMAAPTQIIAGFDRPLDVSTVNANTFLVNGSGGDGIFGNGNDVVITAASITVPGGNPQSAVFDLTGVAMGDDTYQVSLLGNGASVIMDLDANALDGEFGGNFPSGNGVAGGDFNSQFTLQVPMMFGPTLDEIQAAVFTPDCATAGCHDNNSQAAGLGLGDADTSFAEMVGQFSNQNGQSNVQLVAPGDPNASYLIRKLENTPGITGSRMPLGAPALPQTEIDVIRQWITNGALR